MTVGKQSNNQLVKNSPPPPPPAAATWPQASIRPSTASCVWHSAQSNTCTQAPTQYRHSKKRKQARAQTGRTAHNGACVLQQLHTNGMLAPCPGFSTAGRTMRTGDTQVLCGVGKQLMYTYSCQLAQTPSILMLISATPHQADTLAQLHTESGHSMHRCSSSSAAQPQPFCLPCVLGAEVTIAQTNKRLFPSNTHREPNYSLF